MDERYEGHLPIFRISRAIRHDSSSLPDSAGYIFRDNLIIIHSSTGGIETGTGEHAPRRVLENMRHRRRGRHARIRRRRGDHGEARVHVPGRDQGFEVLAAVRRLVQLLLAHGLGRRAAKRRRVAAVRVAAVVDFVNSAPARGHRDHAVARHGHGWKRVVYLGEEQGQVALLATAERGDERQELVEVVPGSVLECVLFEWHA